MFTGNPKKHPCRWRKVYRYLRKKKGRKSLKNEIESAVISVGISGGTKVNLRPLAIQPTALFYKNGDMSNEDNLQGVTKKLVTGHVWYSQSEKLYIYLCKRSYTVFIEYSKKLMDESWYKFNMNYDGEGGN